MFETSFQKKSVPSCKTPILPSTYSLAFSATSERVQTFVWGQSLKEAYSVITGTLETSISKERAVF